MRRFTIAAPSSTSVLLRQAEKTAVQKAWRTGGGSPDQQVRDRARREDNRRQPSALHLKNVRTKQAQLQAMKKRAPTQADMDRFANRGKIDPRRGRLVQLSSKQLNSKFADRKLSSVLRQDMAEKRKDLFRRPHFNSSRIRDLSTKLMTTANQQNNNGSEGDINKNEESRRNRRSQRRFFAARRSGQGRSDVIECHRLRALAPIERLNREDATFRSGSENQLLKQHAENSHKGSTKSVVDLPWRSLPGGMKTYLDDAERKYGRKETWSEIPDPDVRKNLLLVLSTYVKNIAGAAKREARKLDQGEKVLQGLRGEFAGVVRAMLDAAEDYDDDDGLLDAEGKVSPKEIFHAWPLPWQRSQKRLEAEEQNAALMKNEGENALNRVRSALTAEGSNNTRQRPTEEQTTETRHDAERRVATEEEGDDNEGDQPTTTQQDYLRNSWIGAETQRVPGTWDRQQQQQQQEQTEQSMRKRSQQQQQEDEQRRLAIARERLDAFAMFAKDDATTTSSMTMNDDDQGERQDKRQQRQQLLSQAASMQDVNPITGALQHPDNGAPTILPEYMELPFIKKQAQNRPETLSPELLHWTKQYLLRDEDVATGVDRGGGKKRSEWLADPSDETEKATDAAGRKLHHSDDHLYPNQQQSADDTNSPPSLGKKAQQHPTASQQQQHNHHNHRSPSPIGQLETSLRARLAGDRPTYDEEGLYFKVRPGSDRPQMLRAKEQDSSAVVTGRAGSSQQDVVKVPWPIVRAAYGGSLRDPETQRAKETLIRLCRGEKGV